MIREILSQSQEIIFNFPEAFAAGMLMAVVGSFFGVLVVLRRLVFIGATLSEVASCGIAAALFFGFQPYLGALVLTLLAVTILAFSSEEYRIPKDAILAALFIFSASAGILFVSRSAFGLEEVKSLLYGDLILTSRQDLQILFGILVPSFFLLLIFLRPVIYAFVDRDAAKILGIRVRLWELFFYYLLGVVASAASKLGGMLLVFCFLVVPPMTALLISNRLWQAALISVFTASLSTLAGFYFSYTLDLSTNQTIAGSSCVLLLAVICLKGLLRTFRR